LLLETAGLMRVGRKTRDGNGVLFSLGFFFVGQQAGGMAAVGVGWEGS